MPSQDPRRGEAAASAAADSILLVPAALKHLVGPMQAFIESVARQATSFGRSGSAVDYGSWERLVGEAVAAIERAAHQCTLESLAIGEKFIVVGGRSHVRVGEGPGLYHGMAGTVKVLRGLYRKAGERNGKTVDVISLRTGAIGDGWLPGAATAMAHYVQLGTSREAEAAASQVGRLPYSRASFERVAHLVAEDWDARQADIEDELIQVLEIPAAAASISVSLDRASVPMEEAAPRPPGRPRKGAPRRHVCRRFRMAYCATVTLHDRRGRAIHTLRRGQMPHGDPNDLCNLLANDVLRLREQRPELRLALLADGASEMWNLLESHFPICVFGKRHRGVDYWHAVEKLAAAAKVITTTDAAAKAMVWQWRRLLRRRSDAVMSIRDELLASGQREVELDGGARPVHEAITYLDHHHERMNYASAIRTGLPIGSGNVEATCKTLIGLRMKRCGSRWHNDTGNHVLQLRALALSDRWDPALAKLFAARRTAVRSKAA